MDANEALRRYLEQRRELGETELVLDSMSVDDAMKLLGASKRLSKAPVAAPAARSSGAAPVAQEDWRAVVRAAGGAPEARQPLTTPPINVPTTPEPPDGESERIPRMSLTNANARAGTDAVPAIPLSEIPAGLVVGRAVKGSFDDTLARLDSLAEIVALVAGCTRCPLHATATNPVPGTGNPNADFMCVGEAPGANEDEQGVPFVGQAGQLLTKILEAINLKRDDVFIANVLKHRPPGNRNPLPEEVMACSPYLVRQIELVRPKVILALGTFAAQTLLETRLTIGRLRGQIHRYHGVPLIVTYHPAALLRNPAWKRPTWEDVQLARRLFDQ